MKAEKLLSTSGKRFVFMATLFILCINYPNLVADKRLYLGQNLQSAKAEGEMVLEQHNSKDVVAKLIRYEVKQDYLEQFRKTLIEYVMHAIAEEGNIMAEVYYEQQYHNTIWLIERWKNKIELDAFITSIPSKKIQNLAKNALLKPSKHFYVEDLEPLSKQQWRKTAKKEDNPLTIMLFVDAKSGTQQTFKDLYHTAITQFRYEPGVVTYQLSQLKEDDTQFVTYEKFRNDEAFQYHLNFPPVFPVIDYLETNIKKQPFQKGLHQLIEIAPLFRE